MWHRLPATEAHHLFPGLSPSVEAKFAEPANAARLAERSIQMRALLRKVGSPPRTLAINTDRRTLASWSRLVGGLAMTLAFAAMGFYQGLVPLAASFFGTPAEARVTKKYTKDGRHGGSFLAVRWENLPANMDAVRIEVPSGVYSGIRDGQSVAVRYFPMFPGKASLDSSPNLDFDALCLSVSVLFPFFVLYVLVIHPRRLLRRGTAIMAKVSSDPDKKLVLVDYNHAGQSARTQMEESYYDGFNPPGAEVVVLVDAANPKKAIVYDPDRSPWKVTPQHSL